MSDAADNGIARPASVASLSALGLSALGIVFGDIGTSSLYTLKAVLGLTGGAPDASVTLGVLSLVIWTLIVVTTIKYVSVAMRVDNDGEGGILALGVKRRHRPVIIVVGLFGAALIYGDGAITPAISVLSALGGLNSVAPTFAPYVLPVSVLILIALFVIQPQGTARIGKAFGPIMALWFLTIALLGMWGISRHPSVLVATDPRMGSAISCPVERLGFSFLVGCSSVQRQQNVSERPKTVALHPLGNLGQPFSRLRRRRRAPSHSHKGRSRKTAGCGRPMRNWRSASPKRRLHRSPPG